MRTLCRSERLPHVCKYKNVLTLAALGMFGYGTYSAFWAVFDVISGARLEWWADVLLVLFGLLLVVAAAFVRVRMPGGLAVAIGAMLALQASVVLRSGRGERELPIAEFLEDTFTTALEPDEILTEVRVPQPAGSSGGTYLKMERKVGDFATVAAALHLSLSNGTIERAGIGLTAVGSKNLQATDAEASLAGAEPTEAAFAEAGRLAAEASSPVTDVRGSAEYKRHIVDVYVRRGLATALEKARAA